MSGMFGEDRSTKAHKSVEWYTPKWIFDELAILTTPNNLDYAFHVTAKSVAGIDQIPNANGSKAAPYLCGFFSSVCYGRALGVWVSAKVDTPVPLDWFLVDLPVMSGHLNDILYI